MWGTRICRRVGAASRSRPSSRLRYADCALARRVAAFAGDLNEALGSATALGRWAAVAEGDEALVFHAVQRGVKRAGRRVAASLRGNLAEDGDSIGLVTQPQHRQQNNLLEFPKRTVRLHMDYKVVVKGGRVK